MDGPGARAWVVLSATAVLAGSGCGGAEGNPLTPNDQPPADSVPLDGRGGGVLAYTLQPGPSEGIHEVHAMNADGTGGRQLVAASIGLAHLDWAPNGRRLSAVGYANDTTWSVYVFDSDGGNLTRLTSAEGVWDVEPTWSPDGARIVYSRVFPRAGFRSELWLMNADGTGQHSIGAEGYAARWSPDGTRLIYQSSVRDLTGVVSDIKTCAVDGVSVMSITSTPADERMPSWSPDGRSIVFSADYDGDEDIYVMDSDGGNVRRLTDNQVVDDLPRWSPDGTRIAYTSDATGLSHWEVYVMSLDGTDRRRVTSTPAPKTALNPAWRPTGSAGG
jgi:TolB protein